MPESTFNLGDLKSTDVMDFLSDSMSPVPPAPKAPTLPIDSTTQTGDNNLPGSDDDKDDKGTPKTTTPAATTDAASTSTTDGDKPSGEEEASVIDQLAKELGYEIPENEQFEESIPGLVKYSKFVAEQMANEKVNEIFEQFPDIAEYYEYRSLGGDPKKFFSAKNPEIDYSAVDIKDEGVQKTIMKKFLESQGLEAEEITSTIEDLSTTGLLEKQATIAQKRLASLQASERESLVTSQKEAAAAEKVAVEKWWGQVEETINTAKDIKGFTLSEKDKKDFYNYLAKPVDKQGRSQAMIESASPAVDEYLALMFLKFKKFNLGEYVNKAGKTAATVSLRDKLRKDSPSVLNKNPNTSGNQSLDGLEGLSAGQMMDMLK